MLQKLELERANQEAAYATTCSIIGCVLATTFIIGSLFFVTSVDVSVAEFKQPSGCSSVTWRHYCALRWLHLKCAAIQYINVDILNYTFVCQTVWNATLPFYASVTFACFAFILMVIPNPYLLLCVSRPVREAFVDMLQNWLSWLPCKKVSGFRSTDFCGVYCVSFWGVTLPVYPHSPAHMRMQMYVEETDHVNTVMKHGLPVLLYLIYIFCIFEQTKYMEK